MLREQLHYPFVAGSLCQTHAHPFPLFFWLYPIPTTACGAVKKRRWSCRRASYALESASSLVKGQRGGYGLLPALLAAAKARGGRDSLFVPCCRGVSFLGVNTIFHASLSISRSLPHNICFCSSLNSTCVPTFHETIECFLFRHRTPSLSHSISFII